MGTNLSKGKISADSVSFKPDKIKKSPTAEIKAIYADEMLFPQSGLYIVGTECINCDQSILILV